MAAADEAERVRALVARYALPESAGEQLRTLLGLLADDPLAPTAIRHRDRVLDDHLADSLVALEVPSVRDARVVVDLGSGAGIPALPLAIALPEARVTVVESSGRKCAFVVRAAAECGLDNIEVVHARVEDWPAGLGRFDLASARALAPLEVVIEYAAPLLVVGGTLVAWRGKREPDAEAAAEAAAPVVGMAPVAVLAVTPYEGARNRHLHLLSKVMETPEGFPRRPGMALKRPLSGLSGPPRPRSDRIRR
ncbi:MAG TPA: 16S rRNA (guanine(527)-N(7))-methyltransferase RsmG [Solirubrobacteraceae bacterium]